MRTPWKTLLATGVLLAGLAPASAAEMAYEVVDGGIPKPYSDKPGDPAEGRKVIINRKLGNCLACHEISAMPNQPFQGEVGPPLAGVAERYSEPQLRLIVTDAKQVFHDTVMPSFLKKTGFIRVTAELEGKSILTEQQVEDVVAFLKTLQ